MAMAERTTEHVRWLSDIDSGDVASVGGKNASLGEMIQRLEQEGVRVPGGFATTTAAYWSFVEANDLEAVIRAGIGELHDGAELGRIGEEIRSAFSAGDMPHDVDNAIRRAYEELSARYGVDETDVAARSSATAEDMPEASFAGQQETYLNVRGADDLVEAVTRCFASLFTDRAIAYREAHDFDHLAVALSAGIQKMVRSDRAGAGVAFTLDPETGFPDVVSIDAAWGLGEIVVSGETNPDAYVVFTPLLEDGSLRPILSKELGAKETKIVYGADGTSTRTVETSPSERDGFVLEDDEILSLARWCAAIGRHYRQPMDIEWAKDGETDALPRRRGAGHGHDRPRLGADHEARIGDRDRPRGQDRPRGDRQP